MDLFSDIESYNLDSVVEDSRRYIRAENPIQDGESKEDYLERLFWLVNDEIERRILVSKKKRPDYSNQNIKLICKKIRMPEKVK